jgi:hypothetical protein
MLLSRIDIRWSHADTQAYRHLIWVDTDLWLGGNHGAVTRLRAQELSVQAELESPIVGLDANLTSVGASDSRGNCLIITGEQHLTWAAGPVGAGISLARPRIVSAHGDQLRFGGHRSVHSLGIGVGQLRGFAHVTAHLIAAIGIDGLAWVDPISETTDGFVPMPTPVAIAVRSDGELTAVGDTSGRVHVVRSGTDQGCELDGYPDRVNLVCWLGRSLCAVSADEVTVWEVPEDGAAPTCPPTLLNSDTGGHDTTITAFSPLLGIPYASNLLVTGDQDGTILLWHPTIAECPIARAPHISNSAVLALKWNADGSQFAATFSDGQIGIFSFHVGEIT